MWIIFGSRFLLFVPGGIGNLRVYVEKYGAFWALFDVSPFAAYASKPQDHD